ncbi:uncharacterized protein VTP21DRAFT_1657 [Calcarisporiella thermophila]|uniref:uncharacterized protein n=1 Tax=Calcarisporiella thermophila TaxID=911321 RepID=UPI00374393FF
MDLSNIQVPTLWDVKDVINKVKNVVLNYTEMEAKVHEATNNEPWGASSTLMNEIAQGTYNYQYFAEIMPTIYKRFTEKTPQQWRQIYKALQLLEYLVKNGSERVVDDARSHLSLIKMLRNFSYIDEKGKDQGLNVRNRAKELVEMLGDQEKIKQERKKAKQNKNKYTGISSDIGGFGVGASRYGGFGSDSYGAGRSYYDDGSSGFRDDDDDRQRGRYQDNNGGSYDDYDYDERPRRRSSTRRTERKATNGNNNNNNKASQPKKEVNLFDFDEPLDSSSSQPGGGAANDDWGTMQSASADADDDFADFQSAPPSSAAAATNPSPSSASLFAQPAKPTSKPSLGLDDLLGDLPAVNPIASPPASTGHAPASMPSMGGAALAPKPLASPAPINPSSSAMRPQNPVPNLKPDDIWAKASNLYSLDSLGKPAEKKVEAGPSISSLASKAPSSFDLWAANSTSKPVGASMTPIAPMGGGSSLNQPKSQQQQKQQQNQFDNLLF